MPNQEVERAARETIEKEMSAKGYTRVDGEADCQVAIHAKKDEWFGGGLFKIEVLDGKTGKVVWRGKAEGAVTVRASKRKKLAQRTVKKMFKKFPDSKNKGWEKAGEGRSPQQREAPRERAGSARERSGACSSSSP